MKKLAFATILICLALSPLRAQLSSTECLDEVKKVYAQMDHELLLAGTSQMRFDFKHSYIMRLDEEGKTVVMEESKTFGHQFYLHDCNEFTDASDATEAFSFRKNQFLVYRTKSTLAKAGIIPEVDKGLLNACLVKECGYLPVPGNDTLRHKRAYMTVSEEGQKKYKVRDLEMVWNPWNGMPVAIGVTFTEKSMWKWARFDFHGIGPDAVSVGGDVKAILLDAAGEVRPQFKGGDVLDYR